MSSVDKMEIESEGAAVQRPCTFAVTSIYLAVNVKCCFNSCSLSSLRLRQKRYGMHGISSWSGHNLFRLNKCKQWEADEGRISLNKNYSRTSFYRTKVYFRKKKLDFLFFVVG